VSLQEVKVGVKGKWGEKGDRKVRGVGGGGGMRGSLQGPFLRGGGGDRVCYRKGIRHLKDGGGGENNGGLWKSLICGHPGGN